MQLVAVLAAGVRGAESGTARIFVKGSSSLATYYTDVDGTIPVTSGVVPLDAYGSATVYVGQVVDVIVYDSSGTAIRSFREQCDASAIVLRSDSFTGRDSEGKSGASKDVTLSSVMDLWNDSAGAVDWKVRIGSTDYALNTFLAALSGLFINVKASPYNAKGDSFTDDAGAIQAALDAGGLSGVPVWFPPGNYLVSSIAVFLNYKNHTLIGSGREVTVIRGTTNTGVLNVATPAAGARTDSDRIVVSGLSLLHQGAHAGTTPTCYLNGACNITFRDCSVRTEVTTGSPNLVLCGSNKVVASFYGCDFFPTTNVSSGVNNVGAAAGTDFRFIGCSFKPTGTAWGASNRLINCEVGDLTVVGCLFDGSGVVTANWFMIRQTAAAGKAVVCGSRFTLSAGSVSLLSRWVIESGNIFEGDLKSSVVPIWNTDAVAGIETRNHWDAINSRKVFIAGTAVIDASAPAGYVQAASNNVGPTVQFPTVHPGREWTLVLHNTSASNWAPAGTSGATVKGGALTVNANTVSVFRVIGNYNSVSGNHWFIVLEATNTTP